MPNLAQILQQQLSKFETPEPLKLMAFSDLPRFTYSKNPSVAPAGAKIEAPKQKTASEVSKMIQDDIVKFTDPTKKGFADTKVGGFLGNNSGVLNMVSEGMNIAANAIHSNRKGLQKTSETSNAIKNTSMNILQKVNPAIGTAVKLFDGVFSMIGGNLGRATGLDRTISSIPVIGPGISMFTGKTDTFKGDINYINTSDFGGTVADSTRAQDISGVKSLHKRRLNKQIESAQQDYEEAAMKVDWNNQLFNNSIGDSLFSMNQSKYYPGNQQIMLSKKGSKFPELDAVRALLESSKVKSFKSGGKIEKENIIPTGALHKNLHHIEEANPELEGKITKKGIPVGTYEDGGEFSQNAEIESGEIIYSLDVTKQIEEYWQNYKESGDDNIAIECGKYLVDQIFNNTRDDDKVIKKTE